MMDMIASDYGDVVTLRALASKLGRQPAHLGRVFRREVGTTVRDYVTRVRLEHASRLIRDGVKIEAVALSVGYRSKKNFYQQFRKRYGTTPVLYRSHPSMPVCEDAARGHAGSAWPAGPPADAQPPSSATSAVSDPVSVSGLASIVRTSNRAWRLAVRAQQLMLTEFHRLRLAIILTDDAGHYIGANRAALAVIGYSPNEFRALSTAQLFVTAPHADTRCVWQLLVPSRTADRARNATLRTKTGEAIAIHLVTLRNFLWGQPDMCALLEGSR
jgi:PAS domain S-box-containing protein